MLIDAMRRKAWPLVPVLCVAFTATSLPPRVAGAQEAPAPPAEGDSGGGAESPPSGGGEANRAVATRPRRRAPRPRRGRGGVRRGRWRTRGVTETSRRSRPMMMGAAKGR